MRWIGFYDYTVILTYLSLFSGLIGMKNAADGRLGAAIVCLLVSGFCDLFDGVVARSKKGRTGDRCVLNTHYFILPSIRAFMASSCSREGSRCCRSAVNRPISSG